MLGPNEPINEDPFVHDIAIFLPLLVVFIKRSSKLLTRFVPFLSLLEMAKLHEKYLNLRPFYCA